MTGAHRAGKATGQKKKRRASVPRPPNRWQRSADWKRIASAALKAFHSQRHKLPKCGAHARSTGEPCQQLALENGRCYWHGGASPSGADQTTRQLRRKKPSRQRKTDWRKVEGKLKRWKRDDDDRKRRLALMTPNEFAAYFRRTQARHGHEFRKIVDAEMRRRGFTRSDLLPSTAAPVFDPKPAQPVNPEVAALEDEIARLRALQARLLAGESPQPRSAPAQPAQNGATPAADVQPGRFPDHGVFA